MTYCTVQIKSTKPRQHWPLHIGEEGIDEKEVSSEEEGDSDTKTSADGGGESLLGKSLPVPPSFLRYRPTTGLNYESINREPTAEYLPPEVREGEEFDLTLEGGIIAFKRAPIDEGSLERE